MYVDAVVVPVRKDRLEEYRALAAKAGALWREHGALSHVECVGDDVPVGTQTSFPRSVQLREDEVVVIAWITYPSRAARDATNAKVMADPRMDHPHDDPPFDRRRIFHGGFAPLVAI